MCAFFAGGLCFVAAGLGVGIDGHEGEDAREEEFGDVHTGTRLALCRREAILFRGANSGSPARASHEEKEGGSKSL
jgi:hypothetical protein